MGNGSYMTVKELCKMKYESGETFESMSLRYSMILSLLNYSGIGITVPVPKLTDGQLIEKLRKSSYSESTERLLVLFAYGMIDEKLLRFFTLGKPLKCEDTVAAESLILKFENEETSKSERYVELNSDMLDLKALANALQMCAETSNSDKLTDINFDAAYEICSAKHNHITIKEGYCIPDEYLLTFASLFKGLMAAKSSDILDDYDPSDTYDEDEQIIFKNAHAAYFIEYYIEKLFGRDYISDCLNDDLPLEVSDERYLEYLKDKKLSFTFNKYLRKHYFFSSKYNHLDYCKIKTESGCLSAIDEEPDEKQLTLRIDASEVSCDDTPKDIIKKILRREVNTFPAEDTIMQTSYDGTAMMFAYSKGAYTEINYNQFNLNLVDYERIQSLVKIFSDKHLIRMTENNSVEIIVNFGGVNYRQANNITDDEFEAVKGMIREQLAKRFALERKKTEGLRSMSQLKVEAETAKRNEAIAKQQAEEEKRRRLEEEHAKRSGRKTSGQ